jgi:Cytidylate kinase-like family
LTAGRRRRSVADVPSKVVCISHATGAAGGEVAQLVADRLGYLYVDEEIVARAAAQGGVEPGDVADEERRKSLVLRILDAIAEGGGSSVAMGTPMPVRGRDEPSSTDIRALIREAIVQTAARGNVVIGAHAASHALGGETDALRVLITASSGTRARRVAESEGTAEADAMRTVKEADAARRDYLRRFYGVDEDPTQYDLVINTDALSPADAAEIVAAVATREAPLAV